jgi:hypothetical protein
MFERDYAVWHRKRAFDIGQLSQGFIVIQKTGIDFAPVQIAELDNRPFKHGLRDPPHRRDPDAGERYHPTAAGHHGVGFGIRKSRAARDAARAFVWLRDRRADGHTLHAKACCEREATGQARDRPKGEPYFCTRQHPDMKGGIVWSSKKRVWIIAVPP